MARPRRTRGEIEARRVAALLTGLAATLLLFVSCTLSGSDGMWTAIDTVLTLPAVVFLALAVVALRRARRIRRRVSASTAPAAPGAAPAPHPAPTGPRPADAPSTPPPSPTRATRDRADAPQPVPPPDPAPPGHTPATPTNAAATTPPARRTTTRRPVNRLYPSPADRADGATIPKTNTTAIRPT